jgi:PIN domain nuclease of toxin-antitoxin system
VKILLDTHVWLWLAMDPPRVSDDLRDRITHGDTEVFVSAASLWEVVIKVGIGKLDLPDPVETFWQRQTHDSGISPLVIRPEHVLEVGALPDLHRDPFDRLLVAQARVEGLTLATADRLVRAYPVVTFAAEAP